MSNDGFIHNGQLRRSKEQIVLNAY